MTVEALPLLPDGEAKPVVGAQNDAVLTVDDRARRAAARRLARALSWMKQSVDASRFLQTGAIVAFCFVGTLSAASSSTPSSKCTTILNESCGGPGQQTCKERSQKAESCKEKEKADKGPNMDDPNLRRKGSTVQ